MKYSHWIGVAAALLLILVCFLPWAFYPDLRETFNGFYSHGNVYGKPGKALVFLALLSVLLFAIPRVWAQRANMVVCALAVAFAFKSYVLFSSCYRGTCPEKLIAIYLVLVFPVIMILASVLPDIKLRQKEGGN